MRKVLVNIFYYSGIFHIVYYINKWRSFFPILVFHRVSPHYDELTEPLSPNDLQKVLTTIGKYYTYSKLNDVHKYHNPCVITFDDATHDFYDYALPILKRQNIPVILFIPTEAASSSSEIWTNKLFSFFEANKNKNLSININGITYKIYKNLNNRVCQIRKILSKMFEMTIHERSKKVSQINMLPTAEHEYAPLTSTLSISELTTIYSDYPTLIEFGSHSHTHSCLHMLSTTELHDDLIRSKNIIEKITHKDCEMISYPVGMISSLVTQKTKAFYKYAFTTEGSHAAMNLIDSIDYRYAIPRISVYTNNDKELFIRINGLNKIIEVIRIFFLFFKNQR
ncbi:hypothetical protein GMJAKD_12295 [Candidatus Electrothrix aarhusensis]